jgi:hypothetical protein
VQEDLPYTLRTNSVHLVVWSRLQHGLPAELRWSRCRFGQNCRKRQTRQVGLNALRTITTPRTVYNAVKANITGVAYCLLRAMLSEGATQGL